jgi:hypothetical protein
MKLTSWYAYIKLASCHVFFLLESLLIDLHFFLQHNRVESQANTIRTLERCLWSFGPREAGGSSDPWIRSSSQSSVACQNNLSHEIDLLVCIHKVMPIIFTFSPLLSYCFVILFVGLILGNSVSLL